MNFSPDLLQKTDTIHLQPTNSIHLTSPRLKNRKIHQNIENDNNNLSDILNDKKSVDKNSYKSNKTIDKEIMQRQNYIESLENKFQIFNEIVEKSKTDQKQQNNNNELTEICSQIDLSGFDSDISFEKKLVQKTELELEMLGNLKKLNGYIENEQKIDNKIIKFREQFINYLENDSVTEIDESNIQEKIDQLSQFLSDFDNFINNKNIIIDLNNNQSLPLSPRRIHKKIKNNKSTTKPTKTTKTTNKSSQSMKKSNQSLQSPKQLSQITHQNPYIMRPNNSKVVYNPSLKENINQINDDLENQKNHKIIKFVNKENNTEQTTPRREDHKSILRVKKNLIEIDQISIQSNTKEFNEELDNKIQKKLTIDTSNLVSEPTTPTSPRNSPRHYPKKSPNIINNDEDDLIDMHQSPKVIKNNDGKEGTTTGTTTKSSKSNSNTQKPRETTGAIMSKKINGLLNTGDDGSDSEPNGGDLHDNQGTGGHKASSSRKNKKKKPLCLLDFIHQMGNVIVDNLEKAIGKPISHKHKKKSDNISLDNPDTFKYSNVKADEIIGLDDSEATSESSDYDDYDYEDDDSATGGSKSGSKSHHHGEKVKGKGESSRRDGHVKKSEEINMNGLSKKQEEEILKIYEQGGEIPKGYTVLVGKDGKKMIVQTVFGIEDEDDEELKFFKEALIRYEMEYKEMEEQNLRKSKKEKINKRHRGPPEFDYEVAEDEDFSPIIRKRLMHFHQVTVERDGRLFDERQPKPVQAFEYIEVDLDEKNTEQQNKKDTKSNDKNNSKQNEEFSSEQRTQLVKRYIEFELYDVESEGGTIRKAHVPIPPKVEYEWIQEKDDPTTIGKYPKQWGYRWTYGSRGKRIKVCFDKRSMVEEESRDWKGNPIKVMKKVRMEAVQVECDDGKKRTIRRPIQKIEFEFFEEENEDGSYSIVKRPIIFTQLENGNWKRLDSDHDFFYEQIEKDGKLVLEKRHKEYELVDVECEDGKIRKVKREVEQVEYEEIIDEKTGKKKVVPRKTQYAYIIIEDENGNKIRARKEILNEDEKYEYIGSYDADGNFTLVKQKIKYGYRFDFNGRRIRYRIPDNEIIQDEEGNVQQKEIEYEQVEVELENGTKVKVLRRKEDYEYVQVTDEKTGETRYEKRKVEYTTTTTVDKDGNTITVRTKVTQDFDEVEDGVDENGKVIYKKIPREYETVTMKNAKGELITVKRAKRYNYETVVDENGVAHQVRKEKIKPKRVRKSVKRLFSFPKPLPRSKSFSYYRRYPKNPEIKGQKGGGGGIKPSTSISNITTIIQKLKRQEDVPFLRGTFLNYEDFYERTLLGVRIRNARSDLQTTMLKKQSVQDNIDYTIFQIRSKLPLCKIATPNQLTIKKPPVNGSDLGIQTLLTMVEMNEFHMKVKSGMLTNKSLSTLTGNTKVLADYLDKLHRDHQKVQNLVDQHVKEGDEYLATIRIYKPTPDSVAMPPETRKRMELQKSFAELDKKCKKIQADLDAAREKLYLLREKAKDQECLTEMKSGKVDKKKKVRKYTMKELKELKSRVIDENKKVMSQLKLAEIEEESLDKKLNLITPNYSEDEINNITDKIDKMKKKIVQLKKQFRVKRKIPEEKFKHSYILSSKDEISEFEKRRKLVSSQISNSDKREQEIIDNINGMTRVMEKDNLRIPVDRLVTVFE